MTTVNAKFYWWVSPDGKVRITLRTNEKTEPHGFYRCASGEIDIKHASMVDNSSFARFIDSLLTVRNFVVIMRQPNSMEIIIPNENGCAKCSIEIPVKEIVIYGNTTKRFLVSGNKNTKRLIKLLHYVKINRELKPKTDPDFNDIFKMIFG